MRSQSANDLAKVMANPDLALISLSVGSNP